MQSLSEIDTTSQRASKAAGFSWGVAEAIGKSLRSLDLFGLPVIINLNLYLNLFFHFSYILQHNPRHNLRIICLFQ